MTYSVVRAASNRNARHTVKLRPSAFADTWEAKPTESIEIGLRLIPEGEYANARSVAVKAAMELHPDLDERSEIWLESYNQALIQWAVAHGTCKPDNVTEPFWEMAADVVPLALSSAGTLRLYEELEILAVTESPLSPEIDDVGLEQLASLFADRARLAALPPATLRRLRRLLGHVLAEAEAGGADLLIL